MGLLQRVCFILISVHLFAVVSAQEMDKRILPGFVGMRGKKYLEDATEFYKRKPQFFIGVKGKKNFYDFLENPDSNFKRTSMGFMGVRGKKETLIPENEYYLSSQEYVPKRDGSLIGQIEYSSNEIPNDSEFPLLNELLNEYLRKFVRPTAGEPESNEMIDGTENEKESGNESETENVNENVERISNEVEKRAANIHQFFGVRGKKSAQSKRPYDMSFRGKFIGVRGKKDLRNSNPHEIKFLLNGPFPKRKSQMGFLGMRGRKWIDGAQDRTTCKEAYQGLNLEEKGHAYKKPYFYDSSDLAEEQDQ